MNSINPRRVFVGALFLSAVARMLRRLGPPRRKMRAIASTRLGRTKRAFLCFLKNTFCK